MDKLWVLDQPAMIYVKSSRSFVILNKHHEALLEFFDVEEAIFWNEALSKKYNSLVGLSNKNDNLKRWDRVAIPKLKVVHGLKGLKA